ncbi:TonB-dependent siderophore receptor [Novosphingobium mangrovi (ex Huang et al. 2023)]|uniref:TonB-dependent receptor n=1 Tax=Novosphingobium mangrovi (ex Huang et al. 2023) TaxID=2976432 RepID=A0ABT2I1W5_9SPHN|nr:TonB-dependent receptor [Novosphingobium mangrovi (ex Huang et al. 2023)]MCT2398798.1 TonB-dependent receptor [Novosphingobium mangrovi (ex Huang et al. 2023)]
MAAVPAHAEEAGDPASTASNDDGMSVLVVTGTREKSAILPADTDAFGLGMSQVETPRATSTVSLSMIDQYSLTTVRDLIAVTPGVFTASFYGVDGTVNIRGEYADNYFRGFKRVENQGTYITPIESALNLEIVRGAASPAYGTGRAGGYVNFTPRSERAVRFKNGLDAKGEVVASLGTYNYYRASAEYGTPFKIGEYDAGVDLYVEKAQASQYFHGIEPRHTLVQGGFATDLPGGWEFQAGLQYYDASGMQGSTGVNRLTQDLIDNGIYISGSPIAQIAQPGAAYITPADIVAIGGVTKYWGFSSDYSTLDPATIQEVKLSRRAMLTSEYDFGDSETTTAWFDLSRNIGPGTLKLQGFLDDLNADSYNSYGFAKSLRDRAEELRLSYTGKVDPAPWLSTAFVVGAGYRRYEADESYVFARGYMVLDRQDISTGATADSIFNPVYVSGEPFDQVYHSEVDEYAGFLNADVSLFDQLKFTGGVRYDWYDVQSINTGLLDYSGPLDTLYKASKGAWSWSASVRYVTPFGIVPYFTRSRSYALETLQGGAVTPGNVANDTFLSPADLTEGGVKGSFFDDKLFTSLSVYRQRRTQSELLSGNFVGATTKGVEAEIRWAINRNFGLSAVATRQKTKISGTSFLVVTPEDFGLDYTDGWGFIYQAATSGFPGLETGYVDRTQPRYVFGLFANYEAGNGFGATLGGNYVDKTSGHLPGAIEFPDYVLLRGSVHYEIGRYRFAINVNNILNERYYVPQRSTDTEGSAFPGEGRTAILKVTARF